MSATFRGMRRRGLTLIELVVVLVILVALAGILIPMLPNMLTRAHTSAGATNNTEVNKFVQTYEQLYQKYPIDLDSLSDATGVVADYVPNSGGGFTTVTLTGPQADALINAGITQVVAIHPTTAALGTNSPTFNPYTGATITIATGAKLVGVSEAMVETGATALVRDSAANTGDVYVVLGLGRRTDMIGKVVSDPPTHFAESAAGGANKIYGRYGLVFRITRGSPGGATDMEHAAFVGSVAFHDDGLVTSDGHLEEWYNTAK